MAENKKEKRGFWAEAWDFAKGFLITLAVVLVFVNFVAHPVNVVGRSMEPTLIDGEYGFTSMITKYFSTPKRGQIVVITMEEDENGDGKTETSHWVKRVIGLPGDTIESRDDVIYLNGEPLDESAYIDEDWKNQMIEEFGYFNKTIDSENKAVDFGPVTLGEDEYWVMGDNRPRSKDSRIIGPVSRDKIYGTDVMVLYPFNKMGVR